MASTYKSIRDIDWPLLLITLAISAVGILQIYSATHENKWKRCLVETDRLDRRGIGSVLDCQQD